MKPEYTFSLDEAVDAPLTAALYADLGGENAELPSLSDAFSDLGSFRTLVTHLVENGTDLSKRVEVTDMVPHQPRLRSLINHVENLLIHERLERICSMGHQYDKFEFALLIAEAAGIDGFDGQQAIDQIRALASDPITERDDWGEIYKQVVHVGNTQGKDFREITEAATAECPDPNHAVRVALAQAGLKTETYMSADNRETAQEQFGVDPYLDNQCALFAQNASRLAGLIQIRFRPFYPQSTPFEPRDCRGTNQGRDVFMNDAMQGFWSQADGGRQITQIQDWEKVRTMLEYLAKHNWVYDCAGLISGRRLVLEDGVPIMHDAISQWVQCETES